MSVNSVQDTASVSGQYTIRAKHEAQSASQAHESLQAVQNQNVSTETRASEIDTYDKGSPAGVQPEGVYSVSHEQSGDLRVDYVQPAGKSDGTGESQSAKNSQPVAESQPASAGAVSESSGTSSSNDDELETLQRQKNELQQKLNRENDENVKAQLRLQLQNIEAQIIQLKIS